MIDCRCLDCGTTFDAEPEGGHRLMCGDALQAEAYSTVLAGKTANVVFTSPPYASQRKYDKSSGFKPIAPDNYVAWFAQVSDCAKEFMDVAGSYFLNIKEHSEDGQRHLYVKDLTIAHVRQWGWRFVDEFCWRDTKNGVPGWWANRFKDAWEPVFHFCAAKNIKFRPLANGKESNAAFAYSPETGSSNTGSGLLGTKGKKEDRGVAWPSNVIELAASSESGHSAAFPVALPAWFIRAFSDPGDVVLDPFMGSGSTLIAAEQERRVACGLEISSAYTDVAVRRWELFTGREAVLDDDGRTFAALAPERLGKVAAA